MSAYFSDPAVIGFRCQAGTGDRSEVASLAEPAAIVRCRRVLVSQQRSACTPGPAQSETALALKCAPSAAMGGKQLS